MMQKKSKIAVAVVLSLLVLLFLATNIASRILKAQVIEALGPDSDLDGIRIGLTGVIVEGLRIHGARDWPAQDALRAKQVVIRPDLSALLTGKYQVSSILIDKAYLSVLRTANGRIRLLPSLLEKPAGKKKDQNESPPLQLGIGHIKLQNCSLEFYDATLRKPPFKLRMEQLQAEVTDLQIPNLDTRSDLSLEAVIKGVQRDGHVSIAGWIQPSTQDSSIQTTLRGIDLVALEPYLIKASEAGVQRGSLDMNVRSEVRKKQLHAPGSVSLAGLRLSSSSGSFMGVPRAMVLSLLKNDKDQIDVNFKLDGDLDNPHFSLNEAITTRLASGMAETLGLSLGGLAQGVGTMGQKGAQAAGDAVKDVGSAIGSIFSGEEKKK